MKLILKLAGVSNLPEDITELEFKVSFKDLDSISHRLVEQEIEHRLNKCRFYRP